MAQNGFTIGAEARSIGGEGAAVGGHGQCAKREAVAVIDPLQCGSFETDIGEAGEFGVAFAGAVVLALVGTAKGEVLKRADETAGDETAAAEIEAAEFFEDEIAIDELGVADGGFGQFDVFEMAVDVAGLVFAPGGGVPGCSDAADLPFAPVKPTILEDVASIVEIIEVGVVEVQVSNDPCSLVVAAREAAVKSHDLNRACSSVRLRCAWGLLRVTPRKSSIPSSVVPKGGLRSASSGSMPDQRARHSVNCFAV